PEPGPGEAVLAVTACGVCGSDLHFLDGTARTSHVPITLGHEIAGLVVDPGNSGLRPRTPVVAVVGAHCGECRRCIEGRPNLCERMAALGIHRDGGLADLVAVPTTSLVPIPDGLPPESAATAVDAGATAHHAVTRTAALRPGETVLVIGAGGLGSYALQIARRRGAAVVIVADTDPTALERAHQLGADEVVAVTPGISVGRAVKLLTDGGVDVALEFVGRAATVDAAVKSLRPGGRAVAAGVGTEPVLTVPPVLWSNNEYQLRGSYGSLPGDVESVLAGLAAGELVAPPLETVALDGAAETILARSRGEGGGNRLMVLP
ncbi:MAG TPA: zinc-binding dehydrogenase, partial [Acidimicrobiia bacterium]|nr:zinc-binding dehydrogenase [Acidimicrobiia bacterium]